MPLEQVPHPSHLVHLEVVHRHDLTWFQCWAQEGLDVVQEGFSIGGAIFAHRGIHPLWGDRADQRKVFFQFLGAFPRTPSALWKPSSAVAPYACGSSTRPRRRNVSDLYAPKTPSASTSFLFVSLGGRQTLFLSVHPSFSRIARPIVAKGKAPSHPAFPPTARSGAQASPHRSPQAASPGRVCPLG